MIRWVVVGLGNPGKRYENTRHNVGFVVVERLGKKLDVRSWKLEKKFNAEIMETGDVLILKPQTFMNESGKAVAAVVRFYKIPLDHLIVIHDDLDIPLGMTKMAFGRGPKIHNGLDSVEALVGSKDFWRIRIGVDNRTHEVKAQVTPAEYVLKQLVESESKLLGKAFDDALSRVREIMKNNNVAVIME